MTSRTCEDILGLARAQRFKALQKHNEGTGFMVANDSEANQAEFDYLSRQFAEEVKKNGWEK